MLHMKITFTFLCEKSKTQCDQIEITETDNITNKMILTIMFTKCNSVVEAEDYGVQVF